ncbi:MAG: quinol:cytochrome C oxidoreductase [Bacteroidetes bacterium]|nr:quinol:cytochrome C oxidoreductase [Bacteroidota bacterium]MBL0015826.1 quinol:cytochrome C oxidoreductase [Bacteroidota bacterium]MBP6638776.1 quinol:cytochrome C oxidoreductase [Bacteroidia bacterium]MBP6720722.1 quinol:cytochrome C oxidoreductase [Bacteroidia bacterium]
MAHQASEELKPFRMGSNHTRNFGILAAVGVVLFILGIVLSLVKLPSEEGEAAAAPAGKEEHHEEGSKPEHHGSAAEKVTAQYASAGHEAAPKGHGNAEGHEAAGEGGHGGHVIHDTKSEGGTWRRAQFHDDQAIANHHEKEVTLASKIGVALVIGGYLWFAVALFGVFFMAVSYTANAGWYVMFKRVLESFYRFLPIGSVILLIVFFAFGAAVYDWQAESAAHDALIQHKSAFLNVAFILGTGVLLVGIWAFLGHMLRSNSLAEEANGGLTYHKKSQGTSILFLVLFGFGFSAWAFLWIMSVDPHWFSTIFAVYCFAGLFVSGMTVTMFITTGLKKEGYLPNFSADHLHDIGKFMFAFSVFWAYIWVSQYLLIWYANIPEETIYYYHRFQNYSVLFGINVLINFIFPFIALMTRDAKRKAESLRSAGRVMLLGRFLDAFLLLVPGALGAEGGFSVMLMAAGATCVFGSIFLFVVYSGFNGLKMEPRNHPFYEESLHHSTGV